VSVSRRRLLTGGAALTVAAVAGAVGVEDRVLPGRTWAYAHLGLDGPAGRIPDVAPGRLVSGSFVSRARLGRRVGWGVAYPPGAPRSASLPVVVVLHGRGGDHTSAFGHNLGLDRFLAQATSRGVPPFAVAAVDGGDTYWHARGSGEDAAAMVVDELLPLLAGQGLRARRSDRVGLLGWSMGGYGALAIAGALGADRVAAVVAESPALWTSYDDTAPGAFDDAADFARHTVVGHPVGLRGIDVRIDCGTGDPFYPVVRDYVASLRPAPAGGFEPGGHTMGYWRRMAPPQLAFLGHHLS